MKPGNKDIAGHEANFILLQACSHPSCLNNDIKLGTRLTSFYFRLVHIQAVLTMTSKWLYHVKQDFNPHSGKLFL